MSARSTRRRVLCTALALGAAVLGSGALLTTAPAEAASSDDLPVTVRVNEISPAVLAPDQALTVHATLTNTGTDVIEDPVARLRLSHFLVSTRDALDDWATGDTCPTKQPCPQLAAVRLPSPLAAGQSAPVDITVPAADIRLLDLPDTWGPRGLSVEIADGKVRVGLERTFLLWYTTDADVSRTPVSALVPVVGPGADPLTTDGPAAAKLDQLTAEGGRLSKLQTTLAGNPGIGVAVDPALLTEAADGSSRTRAWGAALTADLAHHDTLSLPWSDPDVGAAAHADQPGLVQLAVDGAAAAGLGTGVLWAPDTEPVDETTLGVTAQTDSRLMVVAPGGVQREKTRSGDTPGARTAVRTPAGTVTALVPDPVLSALLDDPSAVDPQSTPAIAAQRALAELAVVARVAGDDQPHLLMTTGRDWTPDTPTVDVLLSALRSAPWVDLAAASTLLSDDGTAAKASVIATAAQPAELDQASVRALADARQRAIAFAGVTTEPDELLAGVDQEVVAPLAVAWRDDPAGRADLVNRVLADVAARTSGLSIGPLSDVNIISSTGEIRMTVSNTLSVPATVVLSVQPRKVCLEAKPVAPITVEANSEKIVPVTLSARANCDVVVVAQLTTTEGTPVSAPVQFTARVTPTIESVGTIVVGALLAVGLVLGIVRTIKRGQSGRRGSRVDAEKPPPLPVLGGSSGETGDKS